MGSKKMMRGKKAKKKKNGGSQLFFFGVVAVLCVFLGSNAIKIYHLLEESKQVDIEIAELETKKNDMELRLNNISNTDYVEQMARDTLKMVKPNETIYVFPQESGVQSNAITPNESEKSDEQKNDVAVKTDSFGRTEQDDKSKLKVEE